MPALAPPRPPSPLLQLGLLATCYFAAAKLGLSYAVVGKTVTLVWPPSGIALVALLVGGYRLAPGVALGALAANAGTGVGAGVVCAIALGNTLEALVGAALLRGPAGFDPHLERPRDVIAMVVGAALLATTLSAAVGSSALVLGHHVLPATWGATWIKWWLGDMMGVLVIAPLLLVWLTHPRGALSPGRLAEAAALGLGTLGVAYTVFASSELADKGYYPTALAVFPFVIWGALRFAHWGAAIVALLVSALAVAGTTHQTGPFAATSAVDSLVRWSTFVNVLACTGLLLAAGVAQQARARRALLASRNALEDEVRSRTAELAASNASLVEEIAERRRLEGELVRIGEAQQKAIGRELHDGLGQHLTSLALFGASLQHRLAQREHAEAEAAGRIVAGLNAATEMTRSAARGLYPVLLESEGLAAALRQLAQDADDPAGCRCLCTADRELRCADPLVEINLYRIAQEALGNALRHSGARSIEIRLARREGGGELSVADDGCGFATDASAAGPGLGILNLRYRAGLLRAQLSIANNPQGGTTVSVAFPLAQEPPDA